MWRVAICRNAYKLLANADLRSGCDAIAFLPHIVGADEEDLCLLHEEAVRRLHGCV